MHARVFVLTMLFSVATLAQNAEPTPAFPGQTDAPAPKKASRYKVTTVTDALSNPWSIAFLPDGNFLVTESAGILRVVSADGKLSPPIAGMPGVKRVAAQGLHDVLLDPDFEHNRLIYISYFAPPKGEAPAAWPSEHFYDEVWDKTLAQRRLLNLGKETVGRGRLSADYSRVEDFEVIMQGGAERRLVWAKDGTILATGADAFRFYESDIDGVEHDFTDNPDIRRNFSGRVIRFNPDGTIPADNPWLGRATVSRETFAHGFRDPEGAALNPQTGELWMVEHGPQGGDELNIVRPGRDYGWPDISYGHQYDARRKDGRTAVPVGNGQHAMPGVEQPIYFWVPSIAPSGLAFYTGDLFPDWRGNLFVGALAGKHIARLILEGERVVAEESILEELDLRIRDVRQGPDGALYVLGGNSLLKVTPR